MPIKIQDISAQLPNTGSNGTRPLKNIRYAVVHHSAVVSDDKYDPIARYKAEANGHIAKGWKRLGYHYTISRQGTVYLCNPEKEVTWHAGNLPVNKVGVGICLDGSFDKQSPSDKQLVALKELLDYLFFHRPDMPLLVKASLNGHREVRQGATYCPGDAIMKFIKTYREAK